MIPLIEIIQELTKQDETWGQQEYPDSAWWVGHILPKQHVVKRTMQFAEDAGRKDWSLILLEEVAEALDEAVDGNIGLLRDELIQVAAVAIQWVMAIDRR